MRGYVARQAAAIGPLILLAVSPAEAHQLDDAALFATAEQGRHSNRSIESVSLSAAYGITNDFTMNDFMVAIRIPHMRPSDIREAAEEHRGRPRPNDDVVVGDTRPANGSRTAVARRFA